MLCPSKLCLFMLCLVSLQTAYSIIITSVFAGRKTYKTYSFDKFLPPLVFEKPNKHQLSYHGHYTFRRPKFRIKFNIPVHLPIHLNTGYKNEYYDQGYGNQNYGGYDYSDHGYHQSGGYSSNQYSSKPMIYLSSHDNEQIAPSEYDHETLEVEKTPYTGTAQITSFMDNGQIISAHPSHNNPKNLPHYSRFLSNDNLENQDSSQTMMSTEDSSQEIKRIWNIFGKAKRLPSYGVKLIKVEPEKPIKTSRLGYRNTPPDVSLITAHANLPDSIPLSLPRSAIGRYYGSLNFSNNLKNGIPYEPKAIGSFTDKLLLLKMFG